MKKQDKVKARFIEFLVNGFGEYYEKEIKFQLAQISERSDNLQIEPYKQEAKKSLEFHIAEYMELIEEEKYIFSECDPNLLIVDLLGLLEEVEIGK